MTNLFRLIINFLLTLASIGYPLGWLFSENKQVLQYLVALMAGLWAIKALQTVRLQRFLALFMFVLLTLVWFSKCSDTMYWYPVLINLAMLALFGGSLFSSQSLIERLARLQDPNLPPQAISYTRKVTLVWCGFFVLNITICTAFILIEQYHWWALYSGMISYGLMGMLFLFEWLLRKKIINNRTF